MSDVLWIVVGYAGLLVLALGFAAVLGRVGQRFDEVRDAERRALGGLIDR